MEGVRLIRPEEAAKRLGISRAKLYCLLRDGSLRSVVIGRCRRIRLSDLDSFIDTLGTDIDASEVDVAPRRHNAQ